MIEWKSYVASEAKRLLEKQQALDPSTNEYYLVMKNLESMFQLEELYEAAVNLINEQDGWQVIPFPGVDVTPFEPIPEPTPLPDPIPYPVAEVSNEPVPEKEYKLEDVRAALVEARRSKGINVTELLKEFGVENFSAFPAGKYGELMSRLEKV